MDALQGLMTGLGVMMTPAHLYYCLIGSIVGTLIGVLPGIGPLAALSLLMPVTFTLSPVASIAMLAAMFYGAMYGGSTTSVLVNIPGEAASVVTCLDGYQMAKQGRAGAALGMAAIGSFVAGTLSLVALTFFSPLLASVALRFGPPEYCALMLLGLVCTILMIEGSAVKGVVMIALGFVFSAVGMDAVNGTERLTFGSSDLSGGIELVAVVIGLFGISEILLNIEERAKNEVVASRIRDILPTLKDWAASWKPILRGSGLGFLLGVVPGGGPVTASFMSYAMERRLAKDPSRFGKGAIEGVAGPESANNAAVASGMIPLLTLGLPGNAVTALLMGALVIQGVQPGPTMITQHADVFWGVIASMYLGNVMLLVLNLPMIGLWVQLLRVPYAILFPVVLLLAVVGTYSTNKSFFDLWVMLGFGVLGYVLRKFRYEMSPLVLSLVLAPLLEQSLRQSLVMSADGFAIFASRPLTVGLLALSVLLVLAVVAGRHVFRPRSPLQGDMT
ncbi:tripartite tricarboxylate transporter permease [uncultured Xylophilus sp.]|uniref:tripartite tricarboxylate transporter permease n=1 Tax=uncultured Xylophilus sp. TaxID=296832 RepID=UPI0025D71A23|nr:tripartite tricarboxylate transporter permease [uncultured Xylophilus sp.]